MSQTVKYLPAMWETWVGKISWRGARQPTSVVLPGESPRTEEAGGLQSLGSQRVRHDWGTKYILETLSMRVELGIIFQDIFALPFCGDILFARKGQISIRGLFYPLVWKARAWLSTFWKLSGERSLGLSISLHGLV